MLGLPNPWTLLAAVIAIGALTGSAYVQGRRDGKAAELATQAREDRAAAVATQAAASAAAHAIANMEIRNVTVRQQAQTVIREVPVYRDCVHDERVFQRINAALTGSEPEPAGGGQLPAASAPH